MGSPAEKLRPTPTEAELPPLGPGEQELMGLMFTQQGRLGWSVMKGQSMAWGFDIDGQAERVIVCPNGTARAHIRVGGRFDGQKFVGHHYRTIIFFANGTYGALPE